MEGNSYVKHSIVGAPTSITVFLGPAPMGVVDKPVLCRSFADYDRAYGGLALDYPMGYAVRDYFLNGGILPYMLRRIAGTAAE